MAYENTAAEFRPELQVKVEEGMAMDGKFIAEQIFPIFPVQTRKGYYKKIKRGQGQLLTSPGVAGVNDPLKRAPGTAYREITRTSEQASWLCVDRGLKEVIDDVNKQEESRFFDLESSTAVWLMRNMRIAREQRAAAYTFDPSIWGSTDSSTVGGGAASLGTISSPGGGAFIEANLSVFDFPRALTAITALIEKRGEDANTLVISREIKDLVLRSDKMRNYFLGTLGGTAQITLEMVQEKFGFSQILVGRASMDTVKTGKNASDSTLSWLWPNTYAWVGNVAMGAPEMGGAGRTFVLEELSSGGLFTTETYRDEDKRSDILRVRMDEEMNTVNENSGTLIQLNPII